MFRPITTALAATGLALTAGSAAAQLAGDRVAEQPIAEEGSTNPRPSLENWDPNRVALATSVTDLIGEDVIAPDGRVIGEVEEVLVYNDGLRLMGLEMGDGTVIPFGDITMSLQDRTTVIAAKGFDYSPITQDRAADADPAREGVQPVVFEASDILDRHMLLNGAVRYGDVTDLVFDEEGRLFAVEAQYAESAGVERYALPIPAGTIVDADADGFYVAYDFEDVKAMAPTSVGDIGEEG